MSAGMQKSRLELVLAGYSEDQILSCPLGKNGGACPCDMSIYQGFTYLPASACGLGHQELTSDAHCSRQPTGVR